MTKDEALFIRKCYSKDMGYFSPNDIRNIKHCDAVLAYFIKFEPKLIDGLECDYILELYGFIRQGSFGFPMGGEDTVILKTSDYQTAITACKLYLDLMPSYGWHKT